jgi:peroxiredoxin
MWLKGLRRTWPWQSDAQGKVVLLGAEAARTVSKRPKVGQVAPDFEVKTVDGKTFRLSEQRGKAVLLHF